MYYELEYETGNGYSCSCCRDSDRDTEIFSTLEELFDYCLSNSYYINEENRPHGISKPDWEAEKITHYGGRDGNDENEQVVTVLPEELWKPKLEKLESDLYKKLYPIAQQKIKERQTKQEEREKELRYRQYLLLKKEFEEQVKERQGITKQEDGEKNG